MAKKSAAIRPKGVSPVIAGRVPKSLHRQIAEAAKRSGRTMSEELAWRAALSFERLGLLQEVLTLAYGEQTAHFLTEFHKAGALRLGGQDKAALKAALNDFIDGLPERES
jgi:hypothetical protein